jgi:acetyl-CoA carboxylase alpha subunit
VASSHTGDIGEISEDVWLTVRRLAELGLVDDVVEDTAHAAGRP